MLGQSRGTQRHRPRKVDGDRELLGVMRKIVQSFPRHGSERTHRFNGRLRDELLDRELFLSLPRLGSFSTSGGWTTTAGGCMAA